MVGPRVVLDTNVLVAAMRSRRGASFKLLALLRAGRFEISLSVPLALEYEDAMRRHLKASPMSPQDLDDLLDFLCGVAHRQRIFFLWRPHLKDPGDDLILEVAFAARCSAIITHNLQDFGDLTPFGLTAITPGAFLAELGELQ